MPVNRPIPSSMLNCALFRIDTDMPVIEMHFETGEEKLKELETAMFVGAGRFVVEQGKPVTVVYKVSKVVKGSA